VARLRRFGLAAAIGLTLAAVAGAVWQVQHRSQDPVAVRVALEERVFDAVWKTVDREYYDPDFDHERWRQLRDHYRPRVRAQPAAGFFYVNVLDTMLRALGTSHLSVHPPAPSRPVAPKAVRGMDKRPAEPVLDCQVRLHFGFAEAEVHRGNRVQLTVADVERGSGAEQAGVAPGEVIRRLRIEGQDDGCPRVQLSLGPAGETPRDVAFRIGDKRAQPPFQRVDLPSGVRVIRFDRFDGAGLEALRQALAEPPAQGLILDLRHNGGGSIKVLRAVAGLFLPAGEIIGRKVERRREHIQRAVASPVRYDGPLVVLIGPATSSAAEITAHALCHHRRAKLVGSETAGAVLVSKAFDLPDGGQVEVAIADYRTPDNRRLEGVGVRPDLTVLQTLAAIRADRDVPLEAAERLILPHTQNAARSRGPDGVR